jgi:hypothetical protein
MNYWKMFKDIFQKRFGRGLIKCAYCGIDLIDEEYLNWHRSHGLEDGELKTNASADHIVPRSRGGLDYPTNLVPCCKSCNSKKKDRIFPDEWVPDHYDDSVREEFIYQFGYLAKKAAGNMGPEDEQYHEEYIKEWYQRSK